MNQLSWLLYAGNVLHNLGQFFILFGIVFFFMSAATWIMYWTKAEPEYSNKPVIRRIWAPIACTAIATSFGFLACFSPSQDTVYAIAASQLGEQALKTPLVGKAGQALEHWLDKQIADDSKSDDKKKDSDK